MNEKLGRDLTRIMWAIRITGWVLSGILVAWLYHHDAPIWVYAAWFFGSIVNGIADYARADLDNMRKAGIIP